MGLPRTSLENAGKMKRVRLSSKVGKAFQGSSRGISAIEVLIALAIVGVIAIAFLSGLTTASMALIIADERATAESLARSQLESVKNQQYESAPEGGATTYYEITGIPAGYTIWSENRTPDQYVPSVLGIPWDSGNNTAVNEDNGLQRIKLVIMRDDKAVITMEGYKADR